MNLIFAQTFCEKISDPAAWFFATVGALIGVLVGVLISERNFEKEWKKRRVAAITGLSKSLKFNSDRNKQMLGQIEKSIIPNYCFDTISLHQWISKCYNYLDEKLIDDLNWHWYQLEHVNNKLSLLLNRLQNVDHKSGSDKEGLLDTLRDLLIHNKTNLKGGYKLSEQIEKEKEKF